MKISADVITNPDSTYPVTIYPYKFDVSQFGEAVRKSLEFEIANVSDKDLDIQLIDMPANMFKLKMPKRIKAGSREKGKIELMDEYLSEEFEKSITIQVSDETSSRFTIPVKRVIRIPGSDLSKKDGK
ncbi:MAG: hypothetical protein CVT49_14640 [candidate division Zixibacteria bacterium HGW-Zixibacteria-1]|nr:MAG: hypothetical protein CVT49_14640 [candidate division Zixibacteria bacterium HGW-Zixibacteria-1]